jgi:adenine-specific DNA methylase
MALERQYIESFVARLAAREKQMQQNYRPVISVHKWFARRPGSLFRALALAELADGPVASTYTRPHQLEGICLDPFMGGGTPLVEASRLGLSVVGYDTNPMSRWVVERELEALDPDALQQAGERVAAAAERRVGGLYRTACEGCGESAQARYFLWLRHRRCTCGRERPLLADTTLVSTGLKRHSREVHICAACLTLAEFRPGRRPARCPHCRERYDEHLVAPDTWHACPCGDMYRIPPQGSIETPCQRLVAVDYRCERCHEPAQRAYKTADAADQALVKRADRCAARVAAELPGELIPPGDETQRLLRWGYQRWSDLFGPRQRYGLAVLAQEVAREPDAALRAALQTVFSDMLRYQNALVRYDRQALKPTDVFAVHGFPVPRVSCEVSLLGTAGRGSGGFRNVLAKYVRAKRWCQKPYEVLPDVAGRLRHVSTAPERIAAQPVQHAEHLGTGGRSLLRRSSMRAGDLPENSVDLVLTDPPYFANVQYAELMGFCYAWLRHLAPDAPFFDVAHAKTDEDAVGSVGSVGLSHFAERLSNVYCAAARALKPGGAFAFTYHHNELDAYAPLVVACLDAGLVPTRLLACPSEMRASTHIHGRNAATVDAVFVLRKPPLPSAGTVSFAGIDSARFVAARVAALRRGGLKVTAADRVCLRHAVAAARAMATLAQGWDADEPCPQRTAAAVCALAYGTAPTPA